MHDKSAKIKFLYISLPPFLTIFRIVCAFRNSFKSYGRLSESRNKLSEESVLSENEADISKVIFKAANYF